jgi:hypothetical protein
MFLKLLKRFWREVIIAILVIIVSFSVKTCSSNKSQISILENARDSAYNYAKVYVDKSGKLQHQIKTHNITIKELKENEAVLNVDNKKLKKQIGSLSNLVAYWQGKAHVVDSFTVANHDTVFIRDGSQVPAKWFKWNGTNLSLTGIVTDFNTSITYDYKFTFSLAAYYKPQGFLGLGKSELLTDIHFDDKNLSVNEFKGIVIKSPAKKWYETKAFQIGTAFAVGYILAK